MKFKILLFVSALTALVQVSALAAVPFNYRERTRDFSGWTPASRGDINTIGMSHATIAIPSSIASVEANAAGYSMGTASVSAQINQISIQDKRTQLSGQKIDSSQWGLGVSPPPWGFGVAYYSPMTESGEYLSPNTGHASKAEVSLKEFRFTASRNFFESKLALGVSYVLVKAVREIGSYGYNAFGSSYRLGAIYRMPKRIVVGVAYAPETSVGGMDSPPEQFELPGFNRRVILPEQLGVGVGWIPNRFFKIGFSLNRVSATRNTALLGSQTIMTGEKMTLVPRIGTSYVVAEYQNFKVEWALGSYYEVSRLSGLGNRLHYTTGLDVNPYFINLSAGCDLASDYQNIMYSIGLDIVRTLRTFEIIPQDPVPPRNTFLPSPNRAFADGLPDSLTKGEETGAEPPSVGDVKAIIQDIPMRVKDKLKGKDPDDNPKLKIKETKKK